MDRSQVGVLKERDEVRLGSLLERHDRRRLESEVRLCHKSNLIPFPQYKVLVTHLEVLSNLTDKTLEG